MDGLLCDLLWADPCTEISGWRPSDRGISYQFGSDVIALFLERHGIDLICRAHQVVEDGYEFMSGRRLVTVFSAANYCGEFENSGAILNISKDLGCSFQVSMPR